LVTVLVYSFVAHMRFIPGFRGNFAYSFASLISYGSVLMTYFGVNYYLSGIYTSISDTTSFFEDQAVFWRKSSEQIAHLSKSADFNYYHFLQPNQYVENSKQLTKEELEIAFESGPFAYKDAAQKGYPLLIEEGKKMIGNDVNFVDLTMLFKNENRTIYNDKCCHYNQLGYDLIADKIINTIISENN